MDTPRRIDTLPEEGDTFYLYRRKLPVWVRIVRWFNDYVF